MQLATLKQMASLSKIHHIVTLSSTQACCCQQSNAYFKGISLERVTAYPQDIVHQCCCSLNMKTVLRVKNFHWNIFVNGWKFTKLTTCKNFALYGISLEYCHLIGQNRHNISWTLYVLIANILTSASMVSVTFYSWSAVAISLPWMMLIKSHSSMPPLGCCRVLNSTSVFCKRTLFRASLQGSHWSVMSLLLFCVSHSSSASHPTVAYNLDMQQSEWSAFVWVYYLKAGIKYSCMSFYRLSQCCGISSWHGWYCRENS